jgi:hypothetical protein
VIDCKNLDEAVEVAKDLGEANPGGAYEIRPVGVFIPGNSEVSAKESVKRSAKP